MFLVIRAGEERVCVSVSQCSLRSPGGPRPPWITENHQPTRSGDRAVKAGMYMKPLGAFLGREAGWGDVLPLCGDGEGWCQLWSSRITCEMWRLHIQKGSEGRGWTCARCLLGLKDRELAIS